MILQKIAMWSRHGVPSVAVYEACVCDQYSIESDPLDSGRAGGSCIDSITSPGARRIKRPCRASSCWVVAIGRLCCGKVNKTMRVSRQSCASKGVAHSPAVFMGLTLSFTLLRLTAVDTCNNYKR